MIVLCVALCAFTVIAISYIQDIVMLRKAYAAGAVVFDVTIKVLEVLTLAWLLVFSALVFTIDYGLNLFKSNIRQRKIYIIILSIEIVISSVLATISFLKSLAPWIYPLAYYVIISYLALLLFLKFMNIRILKVQKNVIGDTNIDPHTIIEEDDGSKNAKGM